MEPQNIDEYKGLRHEIATLKSCITTYIGFVFLVVSTAFWQLAKEIPSRPEPTMAVVALMLGLGLKLVLFLLLYKFNSHNRYCGYCKLLEQERFDAKSNNKCPEAVFIWEVCLDRLRLSDFNPLGLLPEIDHYKKGFQPQWDTLKKMATLYSGPAPEVDRFRSLKWWTLLVRPRTEQRGTWQFPLYVAEIFAAIDIGLCGLAVALLLPRPAANLVQVLLEHPAHISFPILFCLVLFFLLLYTWQKLMADLYRQMSGSQTVDAFCWKFVPIRYRILDDLGLATGYKTVGPNRLPSPTAKLSFPKFILIPYRNWVKRRH